MGASQAASLWVLLGLGLAGILIMTRKLKQVIREDFGAFVEKLQLLPPPQPAPPKAPHPLTGLTFAVSDVFDIEGYVTGFGHPDWAKTHDPASRTSPVVTMLVEGGATCIGKTVVDELAYSISGENEHYFTPTNPTAPSKTPGGSSSGAAVAVAANLADFSLGIDTVGGVRVPAAFCGIMGFRPSHGALSHTGIIPVSTSLDTVGWFAKDPKVLGRVGHVLLQLPHAYSRSPRQIVMADDCLQQVKVPTDRIAPECLMVQQIVLFEVANGYLLNIRSVLTTLKFQEKVILQMADGYFNRAAANELFKLLYFNRATTSHNFLYQLMQMDTRQAFSLRFKPSIFKFT